jgi:general L-amino acid transport system permease protein
VTAERLELPPPPPATIGPPATSVGPIEWLRANLFSSWLSAIFTIIVGVLLLVGTAAMVDWTLSARWGVVTENLRLFLIGQYPFEQAWRIWLVLALMSVLTGTSAAVGGPPVKTLAVWLAAGQAMLALLALASPVLGQTVVGGLAVNTALVWLAHAAGLRRRINRRWLTLAWLGLVPLALVLLFGLGGELLPVVPTRLWGGLLLTFLLAIAGIVLSFPFGVLLALGRRSDMPAIRAICVTFIEVVRGVPLITILFMAAIMLPLFLPGALRIDAVVRAVAGITLFSAAYVAENVRGGLQAIPSGQLEAANSLGLNALQRNLYIVLPQALRSVIPANVGLFISLLKDTTLVFIAGGGLLELLGIGRSVLAQSQWFGAHIEVYMFISAVFFVLCYAMSQASYRLEAQLGVGKR